MGRICVADQGIGIQDVDVPKLCQAFYQIESDGRRGDGVGLGLSLVMAVADAHSGNLSVESRPEAGSIFSLTFPLMHKESNEKKLAARREKFSASLHPAS
jgi:signal transduction histidine kinase